MTTKKKAKPKAKPKGKAGAKPGNSNARKHGLWAKNQPAPSPKATKDAATRRDIMDEVIETLFHKFNQLQDIDQICKCANAISIAVTAANGCDRTIALVSGKTTSLQSAIEKLLMDEDADDPTTLE